MVDIAPFKGFRPSPELAREVACLPYDVIESNEARDEAKNNRYSYFHVSKPEIDLDSGIDIYDEKVYAKGAENLRKFLDEKILIHDATPCFYVYREKTKSHTQTGLVAGASVLDYQQNIIKKNELTRKEKEDDRTRHVDVLNAHDEPVFFAYPQKKSIDGIIEKICSAKPVYDFSCKHEIQHTLWVVSEEKTIRKLREEFEKIPAMYIADGHHRSAAASRVCEMRKAMNPLHTGEEAYNYFLTVIFPHNHLQILAYNRVVHTLGNMTSDEFIACLGEKFDVSPTKTPQPSEVHQFGMFLDNRWYCLKAKPAVIQQSDVIERLDVSILQKHVLAPLLGIENPRTDKKISFVGGSKGIEGLENEVIKKGKKVAFALYPVQIEDVMAISDAGKIMPPKSTWFEPKLYSGIFLKSLA